jgi:hypothetical protein
MENFNLQKAKQLYLEGALKDHLDCKQYIMKCIFPTKDGLHFVRDNNKFVSYSKEVLRDVYFNRLPKDIQKWYTTEYDQLYEVISDINKPELDGNKINLCTGVLHKDRKPYASFSAEIKANVQFFLAFVKEVICSNKQDYYDYVLKWKAVVAHGKKNDAVLYNKGPEGIGKSTFVEYLINFVFGPSICIKSNAEPLRSPYNKILCGKLLVLFEELPTFSDREWDGVSSKLKDMVTGEKLMYRDVYEKSFEAQNNNNYIINTNVEAIKHSEGRRYFINQISTHRQEDFKYFAEIKARCFNKETGEAFFSYLLEVDISTFNAQKDMPVTQGKLDAIADRLDFVFRYLKDEYILKKKDIKMELKEFYTNYEEYCRVHDKKPVTKIKFSQKLLEVSITHKKSNGQCKYKISYDELLAIANKNKWIHEFDEFDESQDTEETIQTEIKDLQKQLKALEAKLKSIKASPKSKVIKVKPQKKTPKDYGFDLDVDPAKVDDDVEYVEEIPQADNENSESEAVESDLEDDCEEITGNLFNKKKRTIQFND